MQEATRVFLEEFEAHCEARKQEILHRADALNIVGTTYYVSNRGDDAQDGKTPETAWQTLQRVSEAELAPGDGVLFCRGDLFRGQVKTKPGVSYGAYGVGEKPKLYGWDKSLANPTLWVLADAEHHIWRMTEKNLDPGTVVFDGGAYHSVYLIP